MGGVAATNAMVPAPAGERSLGNGRWLSRRTVLWLCALAALLNLAALATETVLPWNGDVGYTSDSTGTPFIYRVTSVYGPALESGLRVGDEIDVRKNGDYWQVPVPGQPLHVTVLRGATAVGISIIPVQVPFTWDFAVHFIGVFWLLAFAAMIGVRGARSGRAKESYFLAVILVSMTTGGAFTRLNLPWPLPALCVALLGATAPAVYLLFALFAMQIELPVSSLRRWFGWATFALVGFSAIVIAALNVGPFTPWYDPGVGLLSRGLFIGVLCGVPSFLCGVLALYALSQNERQRLAWILASLGFVWGVWLGAIAARTFQPQSYGFWLALQNVAIFIAPLGLTYAALSRRLFDIGFVINRAAVFAGVSAVIVASFVLLEWALGKWFDDLSHATSIALNVALALGLGVSLRFVHHWVDRFVDTVFFKKRHDEEMALRRFSREAAFVTDRRTLLERTYSELLEHTEAATASILLLEAEHFTPWPGQDDRVVSVDLNDPAILAMRTWHDAVDLHGYSTAIDGEYAFPMLSHGVLIGVVVCGAKRNGEAFAPDEIDALKTFAHGVGVALDSLSGKVDASGVAVLGAIGALAGEIRSLREALTRRLPVNESQS